MTTRQKVPAKGLWNSVRNNTLTKAFQKKGKKNADDENWLSPGEVDVLLGRLRVILAHVEGNAEPQDVLFTPGSAVTPETKEAAIILVEAIANDDTAFLIKTLQRYSSATLASVVIMALKCSPRPLISEKGVQLLLNSCNKYAEYLGERDVEKVEEVGATLERFSDKGNTEVLEGLCQFLKRLKKPCDELAYIFAPLVLLPKYGMLVDPTLNEEELLAQMELFVSANAVIEAMEFMINRADILFDSRLRKHALLKKGFAVAVEQQRLQQQRGGEQDHADVAAEEAFPDPAKCSAEDVSGEGIDQERIDEDEYSQEEQDLLAAWDEQHESSSGSDLSVMEEAKSEGESHVPEALQVKNVASPPEQVKYASQSSYAMLLQTPPITPKRHNVYDESSCTVQVKEPLFTATAVWDYVPREEGEIALTQGEKLRVMLLEDDGWWYGLNASGELGIFPGTYVERDEPESARDLGSEAAAPRDRDDERFAQHEQRLYQIQSRLCDALGLELGKSDSASFLYLDTMLSTLIDRSTKLEEENERLKSLLGFTDQ